MPRITRWQPPIYNRVRILGPSHAMARRSPPYYRLAMRTLVFVVATLAAGCSKPKPPSNEERVYVSDEDGGNVVVLSASNDAVIAKVPVGKRPRGIRISPDGTKLFVALSGLPKAGPGVDESKLPPADPSADGIGVVDLASLKLLRVLPSGRDPELFDVTGDGKHLWVSNEDSAEASLVDVDAGAVTKHVPVGKEPEGVGIHPGGKVVYVTNEADGTVSVLDIESGQQVAQIATCGRPRSVIFTSDGARAFVACETSHALALIDARSHSKTGELELSGGEMIRPMGLALSPDNHTLYVTTGRGKTVHVVDISDATPKIKRTIDDVGARPWGLGITHDGARLYTANGQAGDVSVIDTATGTVARHIAVGGSPWGIAVR
jgi:YVTN family beta-propeller protein